MNVVAFRNEPLADFSDEENREAMRKALDAVRDSFGSVYPVVIDGKEILSGITISSTNPSNPDEVVGVVHAGSKEIVDEAIVSASDAFEKWSRTHANSRASCLFSAASILRKRRFEINATMVFEVGKTWIEADADTAEAIDFLEYYGRQALLLAGDRDVYAYGGELTTYRYRPLGVGAVIPPWNFPAAILTGMTSSALVTGNTAVLKPASDAPVVGAKIAGILYDAGIPGGVLNFVPGSGESVGEELVVHPLTRFISFTGSMKAGKKIYEQASVVWKGQKWLKRAITEMGGKDAIIVDNPCDLQAAADATVASAFGYQGQKCSACSRAIVVEEAYDGYVKLLHDKVRTLTVGNPEYPDVSMGPVSSKQAFDKVCSYIGIGKRDATLMAGGNPVGEKGYFIEPTIFVNVDPASRLAQEEIFGPVLSVIKASDFDEALSIANNTPYGLTGGIFSSDRVHIERARSDMHVGNLYINRKITGALVGVQPFGGFNMSGTCSKAGGPDYLPLFLQGQSISERL